MRHSLLALFALGAGLPALGQNPIRPQAGDARYVEINHPCDVSGAHFGESTVTLDFDGDGALDLAVGAYGEGLVYIFSGPFDEREGFTGDVRVFDANGPRLCPFPTAGNQFGYDVTRAQLDADPADELIIGAPHYDLGLDKTGAVFVIGLGPTPTVPLLLTSGAGESEWLGKSVSAGDFDGDGFIDIAAAANKSTVAGVAAGSVYIFHGPISETSPITKLENPEPVLHGNFGQHLAVGDGNQDGADDLYVSAIGNTAQGVPVAGQIFAYMNPVDPQTHVALEDPSPNPLDLPAPRFGMHVEARDEWVAIGANRKDWTGIHDAGMGYLYSGPLFNDVTLHGHPRPEESDYTAFRAMIANVIGDATLDFVYICMNRKLLMIWDGTDRNGDPHFVRVRKTSGAHWANGSGYAQLVPGGYEELVLGDPDYRSPASPTGAAVGRVLIWLP